MDSIPHEMAISEARANLTEVVNAVRLQDRRIRLTRRGTPQATLYPPNFDELVDKLGGLDAARAAMRTLTDQAAAEGG
jgi:prevent-host-death family protein